MAFDEMRAEEVAWERNNQKRLEAINAGLDGQCGPKYCDAVNMEEWNNCGCGFIPHPSARFNSDHPTTGSDVTK